MSAHDDRARDEQDQALQDLVDQAQELGLYEQTAAPTAREIPAGEQRCQEADTATEGVSHNRDMADTPCNELKETR